MVAATGSPLPAPFWAIGLASDIGSGAFVGVYGLRLFVHAPRNPTAQLIAALCLSVICHIILGRQEFAPYEPDVLRFDVGPLAAPMNLVRNAAAGIFMALAYRLFVDSRVFPLALAALFGLQMLLETAAFHSAGGWLAAAPALLQVGFTGLAAYWTLAAWGDDLVPTRRRARIMVFVILGVSVVASTLLLRLLAPLAGWPPYPLHVLLSAADLFIAGAVVFRAIGADLAVYLDPTAPRRLAADPAPERIDADREALVRLQAAIDDEAVRHAPALSLRRLAETTGLAEHRLRRVIHEQLGYRNFSAFLHALRVRDACRLFEDPANRKTPILTIALSVGYNSINTFNRGFRETMGTTPSAYRAQLDADRSSPEPLKSLQNLKSDQPLEDLERQSAPD